MQIPMSVVMLGADYAYAPSYLGATNLTIPGVTAAEAQGRSTTRMTELVTYYLSTNGADGKPMAGDRNQALIYARAAIDKEGAKVSTGETAGDVIRKIAQENPNVLKDVSTLALALQGKSQYSPEDIAKIMAAAKKDGSFNLEVNAPWLILGVAALAAIFMLKKR